MKDKDWYINWVIISKTFYISDIIVISLKCIQRKVHRDASLVVTITFKVYDSLEYSSFIIQGLSIFQQFILIAIVWQHLFITCIRNCMFVICLFDSIHFITIIYYLSKDIYIRNSFRMFESLKRWCKACIHWYKCRSLNSWFSLMVKYLKYSHEANIDIAL